MHPSPNNVKWFSVTLLVISGILYYSYAFKHHQKAAHTVRNQEQFFEALQKDLPVNKVPVLLFEPPLFVKKVSDLVKILNRKAYTLIDNKFSAGTAITALNDTVELNNTTIYAAFNPFLYSCTGTLLPTPTFDRLYKGATLCAIQVEDKNTLAANFIKLTPESSASKIEELISAIAPGDSAAFLRALEIVQDVSPSCCKKQLPRFLDMIVAHSSGYTVDKHTSNPPVFLIENTIPNEPTLIVFRDSIDTEVLKKGISSDPLGVVFDGNSPVQATNEHHDYNYFDFSQPLLFLKIVNASPSSIIQSEGGRKFVSLIDLHIGSARIARLSKVPFLEH